MKEKTWHKFCSVNLSNLNLHIGSMLAKRNVTPQSIRDFENFLKLIISKKNKEKKVVKKQQTT